MNKILIIDDEEPIRDILSSILKDEGYETLTAPNGEDGLDILKQHEITLVFLDLWLPGIDGMELLEKIQSELNPPEVIIISGHANIDIAVQAIKNGAFDCIEKPLDLSRILSLTTKTIEKYNSNREKKLHSGTSIQQSELVGECDSILKIKSLISQISESDSRVMILGENGTGKEVIAKEIHRSSNRKNGPFVEVNCAAIPENLIESELFGHEKGAFTGAVESRIGKFESANNGTLFLDEIADMSLSAQAKVLRAIQEQSFHKVGSDNLIDVNIRILCATNKNIKNEIKKGNFREDLYFRLGVIPIEIPPLRDRGDDVKILADYFLQIYNRKNNSDKQIVHSSLDLLSKHSWPGNVRELKNFIERICIINESQEINIKDFIKPEAKDESKESIMEDFVDLPLSKAKDEFEKKLIYSKLKESNGNITKAAEALGIYPSNLHNKIKKHGIEFKR